MILLESQNRILAQTIEGQLKPEVDEDEAKTFKREPIDVRLCDFDDVAYRVIISAEDRSTMQVNMSMPFYNDIKDNGGEAAFDAAYGSIKCDPADQFDVAVNVKFDDVEKGKEDELISSISKMKSIVIGGVFKHFYNLLKDGKAADAQPFKFDIRADTTIYFVPSKDRITTIFSIDFKDKVDKVLAKVFMNEFKDARKTIKYAPAINFYQTDAPKELSAFSITQTAQEANILGWLSFAVLDSHVKTEKSIDQICEVLQSFRNYVLYHIKCAKSYFHSRMRAQCREQLKVLNRAKQKAFLAEGQAKAKKTASGKTFKGK